MSRCGFFAIGLLVIASGITFAADGGAASWPQWRGPNRDGKSADKGLLKSWETRQPKLLWMSEGLGAGYASVSIGGGKIFTMGNSDAGQSVVAASAKDGAVLWKRALTDVVPKHGHEGSRCTPALDGDRLYAISSDGFIACLKQESGEVVWKRDFRNDFNGRMMSGWGFSESPLVDGDWVLCTPGSSDAMIVALDKLTGKDVWRSEVPSFNSTPGKKGPKGGAGYSSIVVSNGAGVKQYVQLVGQGAIGVRASDGKFLWGYADVANGTANIPTPITHGDFVFVSTGYQTGSALLKLSATADGVKAEEVYFLNAKTLQNHHGGMILDQGHVYCGHAHNNGYPICVEMATGKVKWGGETRGPGSGSAAVTFADGNLIFRYQSGDIALIEANPNEYRLKGSFKPEYVSKSPSWAHPVAVGGRLYLRDQDKLMVYDLYDLN